MKCLVTGAKGLLGHELTKQLVSQGHYVLGIDNGFRGRAVPICTEFMALDISQSIASIPTDFDYIFHFAAINGTKYFYEIPNFLMTNNVRGDLNMFDLGTRCPNLKNFVYASSSEVPAGYPDTIIPETLDIVIKNISNSRWSYRLPKILAENYLANSDLPWTAIRFFNVYGAHSEAGHFVHDIMKKISAGDFSLIGANETRCYCHVEDAISATIDVTQSPIGLINIGDDRELSSLAAAEIIADEMKIRVSEWKLIESRMGSSQRRRPDLTKLKKYKPDYNPRSFRLGMRQVLTDVGYKHPSQ